MARVKTEKNVHGSFVHAKKIQNIEYLYIIIIINIVIIDGVALVLKIYEYIYIIFFELS